MREQLEALPDDDSDHVQPKETAGEAEGGSPLGELRRWKPPDTPEKATRHLRRAQRFICECEWKYARSDFEKNALAEAYQSIQLCISRVNSDLKV